MKIGFLAEYQYQVQDGLAEAIEIIKNKHELTKITNRNFNPSDYDIILAHTAFNSSLDLFLQTLKCKKALLLGGNSFPPRGGECYDIIFYETNWVNENYLFDINTYKLHAFGVNTNIYKPLKLKHKIWDYITIGSFSTWKRQELLINKLGDKLAIGYIQKDNETEYLGIAGLLLSNGIAISDVVSSLKLSYIYNLSKVVYIPANTMGGGERAVLEARACGIPVEVEADNPKLKELCYSPIYDHVYYAKQIMKGLNDTLC